MKKIVVLIENLFDEQELVYPYHRLREDYEVHLVGPEKHTEFSGKSGFKMKSTHSSVDIKAEDYEGIIIPGGFSPDYMRKSEATRKLVSDFDKAGKPIAAICHGPWMMASCCDVKGKRLTSVPTIKDDLIHAGAEWVNEEVVVSGNLITSRSPLDLPAFIKTFVKELQKK